jgi:hypothetical protein
VIEKWKNRKKKRWKNWDEVDEMRVKRNLKGGEIKEFKICRREWSECGKMKRR